MSAADSWPDHRWPQPTDSSRTGGTRASCADQGVRPTDSRIGCHAMRCAQAVGSQLSAVSSRAFAFPPGLEGSRTESSRRAKILRSSNTTGPRPNSVSLTAKFACVTSGVRRLYNPGAPTHSARADYRSPASGVSGSAIDWNRTTIAAGCSFNDATGMKPASSRLTASFSVIRTSAQGFATGSPSSR